MRIDRRRKLPVTTLLYALGLDDEAILSTFYKSIVVKESKRGWKVPFIAEKMRGMTPSADLVDAKSGEVVAKAGEKITARRARELAEGGLKEVLFSADDLAGKYLAEDIVNLETGEIYGEAGDELDAKLLEALHEAKVKEFPILDIDHVQVGAFIRNTLHVDKNCQPSGSADGHLPGHAPGRAADAGRGDRAVQRPVLRLRSATTCPRSAASR